MHAPLQRGAVSVCVCVCLFDMLTFSIKTAGSGVKAPCGDPADPTGGSVLCLLLGSAGRR